MISWVSAVTFPVSAAESAFLPSRTYSNSPCFSTSPACGAVAVYSLPTCAPVETFVLAFSSVVVPLITYLAITFPPTFGAYS